MEDRLNKAKQKVTEATTEMISEWLNQMWKTMQNDPVIAELWSAKKTGGQSMLGAGIDAYRVLGLDKSASDDETKTRYRELVRKLHPDTSGVKGTEFLFHLITAAYHQISRERGWR